MTNRILPLLLAASALLLSTAPALTQPATLTGPQLAAQLRQLRPTTNASYSGTLQIKPEGKRPVNLPCTTRVEVMADHWATFYLAETPEGVQTLKVIHQPAGTNQYLYSTGANPSEPLAPDRLSASFAGSDFSYSDLGQEHFHWPHQEILKSEMRISRSCKVLESKPGAGTPTPYSRVLSWIDNETGAIVIAEAYDREGRLLKEFYVRKIEKVDGYYQPEQLQMENVRTGSRTRLTFKFD